MLSQDMIVNGAMPRSRRRTSASVIRPKVVAGTAPGARSACTAGFSASNFAGHRMEVVATLGHGQRDDPGRRVGHLLDHRLRVVRRVQVFDDRADDLGLPAAARILQHQGVEAVLS